MGAPMMPVDAAAAPQKKPAVPEWLRAEMLKRGLSTHSCAALALASVFPLALWPACPSPILALCEL